jgi:ATP-binding cassette, subfamily B, bacterial MsbA
MIRRDNLRTLLFLVRNFLGRFWLLDVVLVVLSIITALLTSVQPLVIAPAMDVTLLSRAEPARGLAEVTLNNLGPTILRVLQPEGAVDQRGVILATAAAYVVLASLTAGMSYAVRLLGAWVEGSACRDLQAAVFSRLLSLSMGYFVRQKSGDLVSRCVNDAFQTMVSLQLALRQILQTSIQLIFYSVLLLRTVPGLATAVLAVSLVHLAVTRFLRTGVYRGLVERFDSLAGLSARVQEVMQGIRVVKSFSAEEHEKRLFWAVAQQARAAYMRWSVTAQAEAPLRAAADALAFGAVLVLSFAYMQAGHLTPTGFVLFVFLSRQALAPAALFGQAVLAIRSSLGVGKQLVDILYSRPDLADGRREATPLTDALRLEDVSFAYESGAPVVSGINLEIRRGEVVAVVGPSGTGKSTLADLVLRLYDPSGGRVSLDGVDVREFRQASYRSLFGVVSQESLLFNATVRENIVYGRPADDPAALGRAAQVANAVEFIQQLPAGYETTVGDRGIRLSGGQRQRVAIARAVYGQPPVLILDEATSSLDTESERLVQEAIDRALQGRTALVIAHRLSTVVNADRIAVLNNGRIEAMGSHAELMAGSPTYRRLYELQSEAEAFARHDARQPDTGAPA